MGKAVKWIGAAVIRFERRRPHAGRPAAQRTYEQSLAGQPSGPLQFPDGELPLGKCSFGCRHRRHVQYRQPWFQALAQSNQPIP
jgi:hypothetical protein